MNVKIAAGVSLILVMFTTANCLSNIALYKPGNISSIYGNDPLDIANVLVDGTLGTNYESGECIATRIDDVYPWAQLDLQMTYVVQTVKILNRADKYPGRLANFTVYLYNENPMLNPNSPRTLCANFPGTVGGGVMVTLTCDPNAVGRFLRVHKPYRETNDLLHICEIEVYGERPNGVVLVFVMVSEMNVAIRPTSNHTVATRQDCMKLCYGDVSCVGVIFNDGVGNSNNCILGTNVQDSITYSVSAGWRAYLVDLNTPQKRCPF